MLATLNSGDQIYTTLNLQLKKKEVLYFSSVNLKVLEKKNVWCLGGLWLVI